MYENQRDQDTSWSKLKCRNVLHDECGYLRDPISFKAKKPHNNILCFGGRSGPAGLCLERGTCPLTRGEKAAAKTLQFAAAGTWVKIENSRCRPKTLDLSSPLRNKRNTANKRWVVGDGCGLKETD